MRKARGFTLIELAVVMFIIGLLATAAVTVASSLVANTREKATRDKQIAIKTALATFLTRNYRLPCPAIRTIATGAAGNGVEAITPGTCTGVVSVGVAPNVVKTGAIPWASLGLAEESSLDGYGNRFTYQVMATATNLTQATVSGMLGNISLHSAGPAVLPPAAGANQINNCATPTYNPCGAVAVIVSHGANGYGAFTSAGQQVPLLGGASDEPENSNGDRMFVVKGHSDIAANPYDDIVLALTVGDLITPLAEQGSLKDYQATMSAKMTFLKGAVIANAYASGGLPSGQRQYAFPASLAAAGLAASQINDPWGTPMVYARSTTSVQCTTTPVTNTVFALTSLGQDTLAGTADDVTVTVTVADVIAIIANAGCSL